MATISATALGVSRSPLPSLGSPHPRASQTSGHPRWDLPTTSGITPGTSGPHMHVDGHSRITPCNFQASHVRRCPPNFPSPVLISRHLGAHGSSLGLLAAPPIVGLHPTGLQALYLPSLKTKERSQSRRQSHQWFNGWGTYTSEAGSWSHTSPCAADKGQDRTAGFAPRGEGRL